MGWQGRLPLRHLPADRPDHHVVDLDDQHHGGNNINHHPACDIDTDHDGPCHKHVSIPLVHDGPAIVDEYDPHSPDNVDPIHDLNDFDRAVLNYDARGYDDDNDYIAAVRAIHNAAGRLLNKHDDDGSGRYVVDADLINNLRTALVVLYYDVHRAARAVVDNAQPAVDRPRSDNDADLWAKRAAYIDAIALYAFAPGKRADPTIAGHALSDALRGTAADR